MSRGEKASSEIITGKATGEETTLTLK